MCRVARYPEISSRKGSSLGWGVDFWRPATSRVFAKYPIPYFLCRLTYIYIIYHEHKLPMKVNVPFLVMELCRQVNPLNSCTIIDIIANSNSSDLSLRRRACWGFRCSVYPTTAQLFGPLKRPLCTYIASMEVNHHFEKGGFFWMIINLYFKRWWFVSQPIKHKESPWLEFQGLLFKVYTKTVIELPDVEMLVGALLEGMFQSNIVDLPGILIEFFTLLVSPIQRMKTPGNWNIHFKMVVSVGWFQIITWKMGVSPFVSI